MSYLFEFSFNNPTQIVFGTNSFARLADLIPQQARVLLLYGGGSIKRNRLYDQVMQVLGARQVVEFAGVEPNPTLETLNQAVALVREQGVDFIRGVGGGSVSDGAKCTDCVRFAARTSSGIECVTARAPDLHAVLRKQHARG